MTNTQKLVGALVVLAILGAYFFPSAQQNNSQVVSSSAGTSFATSKVASQVVQVSTSTIFSQYNGDASSRIINSADVFLTGAAATNTNYQITCATSSTASGPGASAASTILALTLSSANGAYYGTTTSPGAVYMATTSPGVTGTSTPVGLGTADAVLNQSYKQQMRIWPSQSYLNCVLVTSVGSNTNLFDSNITGTISFPYRGQ